MELKILEYKAGERPHVERPSFEMYRILGEDGIRSLVDDHYELLKKHEISEEVLESFWDYLDTFSLWMVNTW